MMTPTPFTIHVPQAKVDVLIAKLRLAEFPDELDDAGWDLGVPLADMKRLVAAWERWDWRAAEERLNQVPQFHLPITITDFGALGIHFVWQQSPVAGAIPLLFVHGWPGSFLEAIPLLAHLATPGAGPAFHVVAPSLPNFGFSDGPTKRGFAIAQYAEVCHKLMLALGYPEYVTQGGDWGFMITRAIGAIYPQHCKASHINMPLAFAPTFAKHPWIALQHAISPYTDKEKAAFKRRDWFQKEGNGYYMEQSTKPQTLAYALNDSPVALLAWIYEKLHDWTDGYPFTDDEIFTWVSIYQFSVAGPGAAHRIYYEQQHTKPGKGAMTISETCQYIPVPLGITYNPKELFVAPKTWCRTLGPVVFEAEYDTGGHFYATEHPERLAQDLQRFLGKEGGAYKVIKDKSGYDAN
ncbi:hypothetical protein K3495_g1111 [Podosphaera aphanis]|nr:hypothetical protein K3495_g1111 [Podosphaera aphanis]